MKTASLAGAALFAIACGDSEPWDGQAVSSSTLQILSPGSAPSADCMESGQISVPPRHVRLIDRITGSAVEDFFRVLSLQVDALEANLLVPVGDVELHTAAESGQAFAAIAYRCPE